MSGFPTQADGERLALAKKFGTERVIDVMFDLMRTRAAIKVVLKP